MGLRKTIKKTLRKVAKLVLAPVNLIAGNLRLLGVYKALSKKKSPGGVIGQEPGLQDLSVTSADYGVEIPIVFGDTNQVGKLIWSIPEFREVPVNKHLGDGQYIAQYNYHVDCAWLLCEGPDAIVQRLWANDTLILDRRSSVSSAIGDGLVSVKDTPEGGYQFTRSTANAANLIGGVAPTENEQWTIYPGSETQLPDPTIESVLGAGNVVAHRGHCYVVAKNIFLNPYFKQLPVIKAEVIRGGAVGTTISPTLFLDRFAPDAGPPHFTIASGGVIFSKKLNAFVFITFKGVNGTTGFQMQAISATTYQTIYSKSQVMLVGLNSGQFIYIEELELLWVRGIDLIYIYNVVDGSEKIGDHVFPYNWNFALGVNTSTLNGFCFVPSVGKIWVSTNPATFRRYDWLTILGGGTTASAFTGHSTLSTFSSTSAPFLLSIPTKPWVVIKDTGLTAQLFEPNAFKILEFQLASSGTVSRLPYFDEANDCLWLVVDARYLWKTSLSTFTPTQVADLSSTSTTPYRLAVDKGAKAVIAYHTDSKQLRWYDANGVVVRSADITSIVNTDGPPKDIAYFKDFDAVVLRVGFSEEDRAVIIYPGRTSGVGISVGAVLSELATKVGLASEHLDATEVNSVLVNGLSVDGRTEAKNAIVPLQQVGLFDLISEDGKVKARLRGGNPVYTIPYTDLVLDDDDEQRRPYRYVRTDESNLPRITEALYSDSQLEYETNVQSAARSSSRSQVISTIKIPLSITGTMAKRAVDVAEHAAWAQRTNYSMTLPRTYSKLIASDPFILNDEGGRSIRIVVQKKETLGMTSFTVEGFTDDATIYSSAAEGTPAGWTPSTISPLAQKGLRILDIPLVHDSHDSPGFYVVADVGAPSADLYESSDAGLTYTNKGPLLEAAIGFATTLLGDFTGGNAWDDINFVDVQFFNGTPSSFTDQQVLSGSGMYSIGKEIIQAGSAVLQSGTIWRLSRLLRGRRGTEWAISSHLAGEDVVPVSSATQRVSNTSLDQLLFYKAVREGQALSDVTGTGFQCKQVGNKPYSPVYITGARDGGNNLTINWMRRSRIGTGWGAALEIPLGEDFEKYEVDIMQGATVKRTITVTSPSASYSAADQTTDFGSTQASLLVNIYQISALVGRGTAGVATI